ncbi:putative Trichome birefringence-like 22 [Tripterygium wilfordii]|uniref:Putative Trichome birefringence-like 22 n=1 Tax=Tripterygium wilfordii TaxID=458696 RepID=A0A7J7D1Z4_TRIWF|nr:protein ALTERED XYLOGLUCAN 4-like [Tripterygium wilfordii]KAF5740350.1 putative Trichome birefringence-like 22 [Tripterygium wilfordii]
MKSSSLFQDNLRGRRERCLNMGKVAPFLFSSVCLTTIFSLFIFYSPGPSKPLPFYSSRNPVNNAIPNKLDDTDQKLQLITEPQNDDEKPQLIEPQEKGGDENCDLFKGHWVPDLKGSLYTNYSCSTIPESKNCFRQGREDKDFLNWRWKPDQCDLPRFDSIKFLEMVRGKKLAFVGDSVSRNHMESLLCLLSQVEVPIDVYKDSEGRNRIWRFPNHNFTLIVLWTKFLVEGEERMINGSTTGVYDVYIDKVDEKWTKDLPDLDYVIISDAHWFFRPIYLHEAGNIVGCVYCDEPNVTRREVSEAVGMALGSALKYINQCKKCKRVVTLLRTFSPSHFENGVWNTGGNCNKTNPSGETDIDSGSSELGLRNAQVKELEIARIRGEKRGKRFRVLDITMAMLMRPDGHPGAFWGNKWMKGYNDCVHWCLPGPIDVWSDFLMAVMERTES